MGQLVLAAAGAAIGSVFGAPQIGWAIGSALGGAVFAPTIEGPRIEDKRVQQNTYGAHIPAFWGTVRMAGNVIWASDLIESGKTSSGKGGPKYRNYTYSVDCAVGVCEGEIGAVLRIWANGLLIYDVNADPRVLEEVITEDGITVYLGSEAQTPDATIEGYLGTGNVPAYRGLCYVVFEGLQLEKFGNRVPAFSFEVTDNPVSTSVSATETFLTPLIGGSVSVQDFDNPNRVFMTGNGTGMILVDPDAEEEAGILIESQPFPDGGWTPQQIVSDYRGKLYGYAGGAATDIIQWEVSTNSFRRRAIWYDVWKVAADEQYWYVFTNLDSGLRAFPHRDISGLPPPSPDGNLWLYWKTDTPVFGGYTIPAAVTDMYTLAAGYSNGYSPAGAYFGLPRFLLATDYGLVATAEVFVAGYFTVPYLYFGRYAARVELSAVRAWAGYGEWHYTDALSNGMAYGITWNPDRRCVAGIGRVTVGGIKQFIWEYYPDTTEYIEYEIDDPNITANYASSPSYGYGRYWFRNVANNGWAFYDTSQRRFVTAPSDFLYWSWAPPMVISRTCIVSQAEMSGGKRVIRFCISEAAESGGTAYLWKIVRDMCVQAGLPAVDDITQPAYPTSFIDVSELTDEIRGYIRSRVTSARATIAPLQNAYWFDGVEKDYKIYWPKRGQPNLGTLLEDQAVPNSDNRDAIEIVRTNDLELPHEVQVQYFDLNTDYERGVQYARRLIGSATAVAAIEIPAVGTAEEAAQMAEANLIAEWAARERIRWRTGIAYAYAHPTDVFSFSVRDRTYTVRITKQAISGTEIEWEAVTEDTSAYTPSDTTGAGRGDTGTTNPPPVGGAGAISETTGAILSLPALRDEDDRLVVYAVARRERLDQRWAGARLYESEDGGTTYAERVAITNEGQIGTLVGGGHPVNVRPWVWDRRATALIWINGTLQSATEDAILSSKTRNLIALVNSAGVEMIQFANATLLDTVAYESTGASMNLYLLDTMLRGRFGTEWVAALGHDRGELVFVLSEDTAQVITQAGHEINKTRQWKFVSNGRDIADTAARSVTYDGTSVKPYAPVRLRAVWDLNGDPPLVTIYWDRRARVNHDLMDYVDVPLDEPSESYLVQFYDATWENVVGSMPASTTLTPVYASFLDDWYGPGWTPGTINVQVQQWSSRYGYGQAARATL